MIRQDKKIIAFDLDGTLAPSKSVMETRVKDALVSLSKVYKIAVISGGSFGQFEKQFLPAFTAGVDSASVYKNMIILPTSGSRRYEYSVDKNEWILTDTEEMPKEVKDKVISITKNFISDGKYKMTPAILGDDIIEDRGTQVSISALGQHAPLSMKEIWDPDQAKRKEIKKELDKLLPEVEINIGGTTTLDILPKGFNKAKGLMRLLDKLNFSKEEMLFVGDAIFPGGNDYSPYEAGIECVNTKGPEETVKIIENLI